MRLTELSVGMRVRYYDRQDVERCARVLEVHADHAVLQLEASYEDDLASNHDVPFNLEDVECLEAA